MFDFDGGSGGGSAGVTCSSSLPAVRRLFLVFLVRGGGNGDSSFSGSISLFLVPFLDDADFFMISPPRGTKKRNFFWEKKVTN
jgi:hypothetical protein